MGVNAPGASPITNPAPNACIFYDAFGTYPGGFDTTNWLKNNPPPYDHYTAQARAFRPYGGANVVWVDGHAKFASDDYLAQGTDYGVSSYSGVQTTIDGVANNASPG